MPVVTFESPGERMAARRLHLPSPVCYTHLCAETRVLIVPGILQPSTHHITHVWHTADPIAMGTCNGVLSSCSIGGYAMESRCDPVISQNCEGVLLTPHCPAVIWGTSSNMIRCLTSRGLSICAHTPSRRSSRSCYHNPGLRLRSQAVKFRLSSVRMIVWYVILLSVCDNSASQQLQDCFKWDFGNYTL